MRFFFSHLCKWFVMPLCVFRSWWYFLQTQLTLGNYHTHTVQSLSQSFLSIVEFALYNVYIPLGGLVELGSVWYRLFQQHSHRVRGVTMFILVLLIMLLS